MTGTGVGVRTDTGVALYIRGPEGESISRFRQRIEPHVAALEARLGVRVGAENTNYPFISRLPLDTADPASWDTAAGWLSDSRKRYEAALRDIMGA
jgi:hypothetical protein